MFGFKLGTLFIGALTSTILLAVITIYLTSRRDKGRDTWFLTGYLGFITLLTLSYTLRYAFFSPLTLYTGQLSNTIVFGVVCLIQFAYHFGGTGYPRESRSVLAVSLLSALALWGSLFFKELPEGVYEFKNQYFSYSYGPGVSLFTLAGFIWTIVVFIRKALRPGSEGSRRSNGSFALLTLFTAVLPLFYLLFQLDFISRNLYNLIFNTGSLLVCIAIFAVYINNSPRPTSFLIKAVGIPLVIVLASFGLITNALMPVIHRTIASRYSDQIELVQSAASISFEKKNLPATVAYALPMDKGEYSYIDGSIPGEYASRILTARRSEGLFPETDRAGFFYLNLYDSRSFFISYPMTREGVNYDIGFYYGEFLDTLHSFIFRIMIIVLVTTLIILPAFPLIYSLGLVRPLERVLKGVKQVTSGQYRMKLPVQSEDELGQLARGFNAMVVSLQNAEGNFKALAENANDGILIVSENGEILFANRQAAVLTGLSLESLPGMPAAALLPPGFEEGETLLTESEGGTLPVEISSGKTRWQDKSARVVVIRDISERKKAEETLQIQQLQLMKMDKMASLGAMVAGMAHEVNNPNQVITLDLHYLNETLPEILSLLEKLDDSRDVTIGSPDTEESRGGTDLKDFRENALSALKEMDESTRRIDHIVKELKRLVRGKENSGYSDVDINSTVRTVCDLSRHMIRSSALSFTLELTEKLPPVRGDQIALEQVVLNLLQNACQSLTDRKGGIRITTSLDGDMLLLRIEDEGSGIAPEDIHRITDPFFTTRSGSGGTGLGLSISAGIIRDHRGKISFESELKVGTAVSVRLPLSTFGN